jgi:hypothetical protein
MLAPGNSISTVEYKQLHMSILMGMELFSLAQTHVSEFYNSRNYCSRIALVSSFYI